MASVIPNPEKIRAFSSAAQFEAWLSRHHDRETELYLRIYKKGSGIDTVTNAEAIEVALCWGWIDGLRKAFDAESFLQRFTPRRGKSVWSQINRDHVARLIAQGRMTPHGLRHVEAAKADGRWDAAYASPKNMTIPDDLRAAIRADTRAEKTFATLNKQNLFALAFRVVNMKTPAGRAKKIATLVEMLRKGETIYPNGPQKQREEQTGPVRAAKATTAKKPKVRPARAGSATTRKTRG